MKLCIIGSRGHYGYVFEEIGRFPEVEIIGISTGCADDVSRLMGDCQRAGASPIIYEDYLKMLDELRPDAVVINGPFALHAQMTLEAMGRGIHLLCEKPIALALDDLDRIEAAYYKTEGIVLMSMVGLRYEPGFMAAWKKLQEGAIGKVKLIHTQKSYKLGNRPDYYKSREAYGGTIPWVGSHALDWIYWFSGSDFGSVLASHSMEDNFENGELEIAAQCQFQMKNGVQASASIDFLRPPGSPTHGDDRIRVAGTRGVIEVIGGRVTLLDDKGEHEIPLSADPRLFSDFVGQIQGTSKGLVSAKDTFNLTRACLIARESADTGQLIHF